MSWNTLCRDRTSCALRWEEYQTFLTPSLEIILKYLYEGLKFCLSVMYIPSNLNRLCLSYRPQSLIDAPFIVVSSLPFAILLPPDLAKHTSHLSRSNQAPIPYCVHSVLRNFGKQTCYRSCPYFPGL